MASRIIIFLALITTISAFGGDQTPFRVEPFQHSGFTRTPTQYSDGDILSINGKFINPPDSNGLVGIQIQYFNNTPCAISHVEFTVELIDQRQKRNTKPFTITERRIVLPLEEGTTMVVVNLDQFPFLRDAILVGSDPNVFILGKCTSYSIVHYTHP